MLELTIKENVYQFNFNMGFMREINKKYKQRVDNLKDTEKNVGLRFAIANLFDYDMEELVDILFAANSGHSPRVTKELLDAYIDDANTDIDKLFEDVFDFLKKTNATKKVTMELQKEYDKQKANGMI